MTSKRKWLLILVTISAFTLFAANNPSSSIESKAKFDVSVGNKKAKVSYRLTAYDLKYKINDNFSIFSKLVSARDNITKSDNKNYSITEDNRLNHDIMAKLGIISNFSLAKDVSLKSKLTYYLDSFSEDNLKYEYLDGEDKENLGSLILESRLNGKSSNIDYGLGVEYKSRDLFMFNNKESYFKFDANLSSEAIKNVLKVDAKYKFFVDLDLLNRRFDPFDTDFDEFPDYMVNDYVTYLTNDINLDIEYLKNNKFSFGLNHYAFLTQTNYFEEYKTEYNVSDLSFKYLKSFNFGKFSISPYLNNKFTVKNAFYRATGSRPDRREVFANYSPEIGLSLEYDIENILNSELSFSYEPSVLITPEVSKPSKTPHKFNIDTNIKYDDKKYFVKNKFHFDITYRVDNDDNPIESNNDLEIGYTNKFLSDKLEFKTSFRNVMQLETRKKQNVIDNLFINNKLSAKTKYSFNDNLALSNEVILRSKTNLNYILRTIKKSTSDDEYQKHSEFILQDTINSISLSSILEHNHKFNEKLSIKSSASLDLSLETLILRSEKMYNYHDPNDYDENKMDPLLSDDVTINVNLGGKILPKLDVALTYEILQGLDLTVGSNTSLEFSRIVTNIVTAKYRPDKNKYAQIDKNFRFKEFKVGVEAGIKYSW